MAEGRIEAAVGSLNMAGGRREDAVGSFRCLSPQDDSRIFYLHAKIDFKRAGAVVIYPKNDLHVY